MKQIQVIFFVALVITHNLLHNSKDNLSGFLSFLFLQHSMIMQRATSKVATATAIITAISVLVKIAADWTPTADGRNTAERLYSNLPNLI